MEKNNWGTNSTIKRVLKNEDVSKILNQISKYFYLYNFNITISSKSQTNGKFIIKYKITWSKNNEPVIISDNFTI